MTCRCLMFGCRRIRPRSERRRIGGCDCGWRENLLSGKVDSSGLSCFLTQIDAGWWRASRRLVGYGSESAVSLLWPVTCDLGLVSEEGCYYWWLLWTLVIESMTPASPFRWFAVNDRHGHLVRTSQSTMNKRRLYSIYLHRIARKSCRHGSKMSTENQSP